MLNEKNPLDGKLDFTAPKQKLKLKVTCYFNDADLSHSRYFASCRKADRLKPEAGLLNKSSHLAAALGVVKFLASIAAYLVILLCYLSPT